MRTLLSKGLAVFLLLSIVISQFLPGAAAAGAESRQLVRVGWYQSELFQEGCADGRKKSGYCYDFLQNIANYTLWQYEYVYGDWTELYHMLLNGQIDFLGGVSLSEDRIGSMLFPETAMGTDQYCLYKHASDSSISEKELSSLTGKRLGSIVDNHMTTFVENWLRENQLELELVLFDSFADQQAAFESGELDLIVQTINNVRSMNGISIVTKIGEEPFYLAVNKDRPDLLKELNTALTTILSIDPFILQDLQYRNYGATLTSRSLTDAELQWVEAHPVLRVGYLDNYLPYCSQDSSGNATGMMVDVLNAILADLGLTDQLEIRYTACRSFDEMTAALLQGSVDLVFPVYGDLWNLEQLGIDASSAVANGSETFFYKGSYDREAVRTLAVNQNNGMQIAYCRRNYPDAALLSCDSIDDCLSAVLRGDADGTVINTLRTQLVTGNSKYNTLSYIQLDTEDARCFGVNEQETGLLLILNRGLRMIGSEYGIENSYKYMESFFTYTGMDFIRDNILAVGLILLGAVALIVIGFARSLWRKEQAVKEKTAYIDRISALNDELREAMLAAQKADAAKSIFLSRMSHDIRTPMNGILGLLDISERHKDEKEIVDDCRNKEKVVARHLLSLINDILELSRLEASHAELAHEPFDLVELASDVLAISTVSAAEHSICLTHADCRDVFCEPCVYGSPLHVRQILLNIISNSIKYNRPGGSVHCSARLESRTQTHVSYSVTISDTGVGMSPEFMEHIFEPFTQEKNDARSTFQGTGLGMSIVKILIDRMGGSITVESEPGKGSTFVVTLPFEIAQRSQVPAAAPADEPDIAGMRILLVEDNDLNMEIAESILTDYGALVTQACNGQEAVELFCGNPPGSFDVILMDIMMPVLDGYGAAEAIRKSGREDAGSIYIAAMTANAFDEDIQKALASGMNAHLAKPIEIPRLLELISGSRSSQNTGR